MFFTINHGRFIQYPIGENKDKSLFFYNRHSWSTRKKNYIRYRRVSLSLIKKKDD